MRDLLQGLNALINDVVSETLKDDPFPPRMTIKEWTLNNTDGPNGTRLKTFRRTKDQLERNLSREDAFEEYLKNRNPS